MFVFSNNWFQQLLQTSCRRKTCFAHSTFNFLTAPQWWGPTTVRKAWGDFSLGYVIFFHLPVRGQQNMFSFFPKEIGTFLLITCCLKFIFPLRLYWIGRVAWVNFKIKDCPSFYWKGNDHNQHFHSYEAVHTTELQLGFLISLCTCLQWLHCSRFTFFRVQDRVTAHIATLLVKVEGCLEFAETDIEWVVWSRGQESFLPHMHIQLIQHHFPTVQHLGCYKPGDSTHVGPVLDFLVCFLSLFV